MNTKSEEGLFYLAVGEIGTINGYKVVCKCNNSGERNCSSCFFNSRNHHRYGVIYCAASCIPEERGDGLSVYYEVYDDVKSYTLLECINKVMVEGCKMTYKSGGDFYIFHDEDDDLHPIHVKFLSSESGPASSILNHNEWRVWKEDRHHYVLRHPDGKYWVTEDKCTEGEVEKLVGVNNVVHKIVEE